MEYYEKLRNDYSMYRERIYAIITVMERFEFVSEEFFTGSVKDVHSLEQIARKKGYTVIAHGNGFATFTRIHAE